MVSRQSFLLVPAYRPLYHNQSTTRYRTRKTTISATSATRTRQRRPQNVDGNFFVDHRCIDCDTCRWMVPEIFKRVEEKAAVSKQPSSHQERIEALQALVSCPTSSIHTEKPLKEIKEVHKTFPLPIDEINLPGVYHCGYHSEKSYGATSYFIVHPDGNILVDSPRYTELLANQISLLGGVRYMFMTHKDDVADHDKWSKYFGCERIFHAEDIEISTADIERKLYGEGPWSIGTDFELIHTPGHTAGSVTLYYKPLKIIFTGDHFAKSHNSELTIFEQYNHQSVSTQLSNVRKFLEVDFKWILPGHGRRVEFGDKEEKNSVIETFLISKAAHTEKMSESNSSGILVALS